MITSNMPCDFLQRAQNDNGGCVAQRCPNLTHLDLAFTKTFTTPITFEGVVVWQKGAPKVKFLEFDVGHSCRIIGEFS